MNSQEIKNKVQLYHILQVNSYASWNHYCTKQVSFPFSYKQKNQFSVSNHVLFRFSIAINKKNAFSSFPNYLDRRVTRGGRGGGLPCPFTKIAKKCPSLWKKCPDCGHLLWSSIVVFI